MRLAHARIVRAEAVVAEAVVTGAVVVAAVGVAVVAVATVVADADATAKFNFLTPNHRCLRKRWLLFKLVDRSSVRPAYLWCQFQTLTNTVCFPKEFTIVLGMN